MRGVKIAVTACIVLAAGASAAAQTGPAPQPDAKAAPPAQQLDPRAVVAEVRRVIAQGYVLPERRPALDAVLAEGLTSGRYDVRDPAVLAERINADLERVGSDNHLNFNYDPRRAAPPAGAGPGPNAPNASQQERTVRGGNHGISELKVLPGNIRYMAYDGFQWAGPGSVAALDTAMRFLSGGDAVIIDLRRNGGGSPGAVQYLVSHFMEAGRPLITFHMNGQPAPNSNSTLVELPAGRMVGKPLYVLTSPATASAAEEFPGHVAGFRLGEVVGSRTAGAGFRNELVPIAGGFVLSVSVGRAVLASTGRDWEAVGIEPTIPTEVHVALEAAHSHALRRLASQAEGADRTRLEAMADAVTAKVERRSPALPLTAYAGAFGERAVAVEDGRLYYRHGERQRTALIPLGGNSFAFENDPGLQVRFAANGRAVSAFEIVPVGGPSLGRYDRTR